MSDRRDDEAVGYKKPPKWSRFSKGQSGNPKGRPRKPKEGPLIITDSVTDDVLRRELRRILRVKDGTGTLELTAFEVAVRAQVQSAAKGNAMAQRDIIRTGRELELRDAERMRVSHIEKCNEFERWVQWKQYRAKLWREAEAMGTQPANPWPHPQDMLLDEQKLDFHIRGPVNEADIPYYNYLVAQRDLNFVRGDLSLRRNGKNSKALADIYAVIWASLDAYLPLRWQIGKDCGQRSLEVAMTDARKLKSLLKQCEADSLYWHKIAFPFGERVRLPSGIWALFRPIVKQLGFGSLGQWERHSEKMSGNPPWPNIP
jgi:hypothetical protein